MGLGVAHLRVTSLSCFRFFSSFFFMFFIPFFSFFHFPIFLKNVFLLFFKCMPLQAFVIGFNKRCFLRSRCSMEMS